jgi:hypothetical protein
VHLAPEHRAALADELPWLVSLQESAYGVRPDGTLCFANPAFLHYTAESCVLLQPWLEGRRSVLDACSDALRPFYERLYTDAWDSAEPAIHDHACPTPSERRWYRMRLVRRLDLLLVLHHRLRSEAAPDWTGPAPTLADYLGPRDLILQCAHCRMTRRAHGEDWDFVPAWVEQPPEQTSHGLCPICFSSYYPHHAASWYAQRRAQN